MIQIDSGLVRELDYVESWALVRSGRQHLRGLFLKVEFSPCAGTSHTMAGSAYREDYRHDLLPLRVPHGLVKVGQQGLGEGSITQREFFQ